MSFFIGNNWTVSLAARTRRSSPRDLETAPVKTTRIDVPVSKTLLEMITFAKLHESRNAFHFNDIVTVFSSLQFPVTVASFGT